MGCFDAGFVARSSGGVVSASVTAHAFGSSLWLNATSSLAGEGDIIVMAAVHPFDCLLARGQAAVEGQLSG